MEPKHVNHPSEEELAAFGDPALGTEALEGLANHLDSCPPCQARLDEKFSEDLADLGVVHRLAG